jgi:hypothetical protein
LQVNTQSQTQSPAAQAAAAYGAKPTTSQAPGQAGSQGYGQYAATPTAQVSYLIRYIECPIMSSRTPISGTDLSGRKAVSGRVSVRSDSFHRQIVQR